MPRQQPEQQAPPVQRIRLRYAKRGRARFTSHRDFSRAFERALRRAGVPMAYSSGFSPHPRISYANASPTGAATEAEYLEIGLAEVCDPEKVRAALDHTLPTGLDVVAAVVAPPGTPALAERLQASRWQIELPGAPPEVLAEAVAAFLARDEVPVERMTKTGLRTFDARGAVVSLTLDAAGPRLVTVTRHGTPLVRPDDVVTALRQVDPRVPGDPPPRLTRLAQGPLDADGGVGDPFA